MTWIKVLGQEAPDLTQQIEHAVTSRIERAEFLASEVEHIRAINRSLNLDSSQVSKESFESLRRLCQLWEVDLKNIKITSHRKIIGPVIVGFKRLLLPILRVLFKDYIRQQREFNAATIETISASLKK